MSTTPTPANPHTPHHNADKDFEDVRAEMVSSMSQDEADRRARIEYLRSLTGNKNKKPKGRKFLKLLKFVLILVVIAGLAAGVFWYFTRAAETKKANQATAESQKKAAAAEASQTQVSKVKHYDSTPFGLGIDYPENWKVTDEGAGKLTVASPATKIKTATGTTDGQIIFMVQTKQPTLPGFKNGSGLTTRVSEKIAYSKPTPNQRAQTYTTFVSYAGTATGGIDSVFVTGDLEYQKDQDVPQTDIIQGDPLVSIFFAKCNGTVCAVDPTTARVTVADNSWNDSNALVKAAKAILLSLSIN